MKPKAKGATPRKTFRLTEKDLEKLEYIRTNFDWSSGGVEIPATTTNALKFAINVAHNLVSSKAQNIKKGEK